MSATHEGGLKAARTNKQKYGKDFYVRIGKMSAGYKRPGAGFSSKKIGKDGLTGPERARLVGVRGGNTTSGKVV